MLIQESCRDVEVVYRNHGFDKRKRYFESTYEAAATSCGRFAIVGYFISCVTWRCLVAWILFG